MTADTTRQIAFLGTGLMGAPMAKRLLAAGFPVTVWTRDSGKAAPLAGSGAHIVDSPAEAVNGADVVFTMLSDGTAVEDVLFVRGAAEALKEMHKLAQLDNPDPDIARLKALFTSLAGADGPLH